MCRGRRKRGCTLCPLAIPTIPCENPAGIITETTFNQHRPACDTHTVYRAVSLHITYIGSASGPPKLVAIPVALLVCVAVVIYLLPAVHKDDMQDESKVPA